MAQHLGVEVVCLKGRVVDMVLWALEKEEDVMVDQFLAASEAVEYCDVGAVGDVDQLFLG